MSAARALEEEASLSSSWWTAIRLRTEAARLRFDAWTVGRRASELLSDPARLIVSLRPECPGSIEGPAWLDVEAVDLVGPGVALAALEEARLQEILPPEEAEMVFGMHEAEAHWRAGYLEDALRVAQSTLDLLPSFEVMLRSRVAAVAADSAQRLGRNAEAKEYFRQVLRTDAGVLRRLGLRLPVKLSWTGDDPAAEEAVSLLTSSPRLYEVAWGFELVVAPKQVMLLEGDGSQITAALVLPGRADSSESTARRIARTVHRELLVPDVDLTQADIRSLDGTLGSGGKASDHVRSIIEEVLTDPDAEEPTIK